MRQSTARAQEAVSYLSLLLPTCGPMPGTHFTFDTVCQLRRKKDTLEWHTIRILEV